MTSSTPDPDEREKFMYQPDYAKQSHSLWIPPKWAILDDSMIFIASVNGGKKTRRERRWEAVDKNGNIRSGRKLFPNPPLVVYLKKNPKDLQNLDAYYLVYNRCVVLCGTDDDPIKTIKANRKDLLKEKPENESEITYGLYKAPYQIDITKDEMQSRLLLIFTHDGRIRSKWEYPDGTIIEFSPAFYESIDDMRDSNGTQNLQVGRNYRKRNSGDTSNDDRLKRQKLIQSVNHERAGAPEFQSYINAIHACGGLPAIKITDTQNVAIKSEASEKDILDSEKVLNDALNTFSNPLKVLDSIEIADDDCIQVVSQAKVELSYGGNLKARPNNHLLFGVDMSKVQPSPRSSQNKIANLINSPFSKGLVDSDKKYAKHLEDLKRMRDSKIDQIAAYDKYVQEQITTFDKFRQNLKDEAFMWNNMLEEARQNPPHLLAHVTQQKNLDGAQRYLTAEVQGKVVEIANEFKKESGLEFNADPKLRAESPISTYCKELGKGKAKDDSIGFLPNLPFQIEGSESEEEVTRINLD